MFDLMSDIIKKGINVISTTGGRAAGTLITASGSGQQSFSEYLANQEVNPICLIERRLLEIEDVDKLLAHATNKFAGQYMQMFNRLSGDPIKAARTTEVLDSLDAERDLKRIFTREAGTTLGLESYKYGLPMYDPNCKEPMPLTPALEKVNWDSETYALENSEEETEPKFKFYENGHGRLATEGRVVKVNVGTQDNPVNLNIRIRFDTRWVGSSLIEDIVKANLADLSLKTRVRMYGFGEITWKELITGSDIVKQHERVRMHTKDDAVTGVFRGRMKDTAFALGTGTVPINRASAVLILSKETVDRLDSTIRGKMTDFKTREKFFESTAAQTIYVIDEESEMCTIYYRGIKLDTTLPLRRIRKENKKVGEDLLPLIKALADGNAPRY